MSSDKIYEQIKFLKEDAQSKGIFGMAIRIAETLGKESPRKYGYQHDWSNDEMSITYDDYGVNLTLDYRGTVVFVAHLGGIETYRPDISDWIDKLWKVHTGALAIIKRKEEIERNAYATDLKQHWGIELTSCAQTGENKK